MISDKTKRTCELFSHVMAAGGDMSEVVGEIAQMEGVNRPAIWRRLRAGGLLPPYGRSAPRRPHTSYAERNRRARENIEAKAVRQQHTDALPRVHRDPCPRCGVRGDIACGHQRTILGTAF